MSELMDKSTPKILYKYADWRNDFHKRLITDREIFFASPRLFNDPFDCGIRLRYDLMNDEEKIDYLKRVLPHSEFPHATPEEIDKVARDRVQRGWLEPLLEEMTTSGSQQELKDNTLGLFSLSKTRDNILMWSHYSNKHTGFCIGYHVHILDEFFDNCWENEKAHINRHKVCYLDKYPEVNPGVLDDEEYFVHLTCLKAIDWSYEREHRYVLMNGTMKPFQIPAEAISEVITGCRMDSDTRQIVFEKAQANAPRATILTAVKSPNKFGLDILLAS